MDFPDSIEIEKDKENMSVKEKTISEILSKEIICKECKENCMIKIKDYKFNLFGCKNGHNIKNISIQNFENTQKIKNSKIICGKCNKINNEYYKCFTCKIIICSKCKLNHDKEHNIIEYEKINFICPNILNFLQNIAKMKNVIKIYV